MRKLIKNYRLSGSYALGAIAVLLLFSMAWAKPNPKVLVFCKTAGYHHASIAVGIVAIQKLGAENKFDVDTTTDATKFNDQNLKQYATIIFLSTTGQVFRDSSEQDALKKYIHNGGGYVGIHAATDCEYNWQWYGNLSGAYFKAHPRGTPTAVLDVVDANFPGMKNLPKQWKRVDEWYHYKWMAKDLHVLLNLDESTLNYPPGPDIKMGPNHPMAWYHEFEGGRAFYTALGHTDESYADPLFLEHVLGGIKYAMGKKYKGK